MTTQQQNEMEAIFQSFEWLLKERFLQLDAIARRMFLEMSACSVPKHMYESYCSERTKELIEKVVEEEGEAVARGNSKFRVSGR
jgi:hypothetical protein